MTQSPPPDPQSNYRLSLDELIAIAVAFPIIGLILWWGMGRPTGSSLLATSPLAEQSEQAGSQGGLFAPFVSGDDEAAAPRENEEAAATGTLAPPGTDAEQDTATSAPRRTTSAPFVVTDPSQPTVPRDVTEDADETEPETEIEPEPEPDKTTGNTGVVGSAPVSPSPDAEAPSPAAIIFPDVPMSYWAAPFITELAQREVITGFPDGNFAPDQPVSRAGYASILSGAFEPQSAESPQPTPNYGDISADFWAQDAIAEATSSGFMRGYPDNQFRPDTNLTRAEAIVALANGLDLQIPTDSANLLNRYSDADQIPEYARGAIAAATEAGLISNYPDLNQLEPNQPATRADIAAMVYQGLVQIGQAEPVDSEYVIQK